MLWILALLSLLSWLAVALIVWAWIYHPWILLALLALLLFAVHRRSRRGDTLAGPWQ